MMILWPFSARYWLLAFCQAIVMWQIFTLDFHYGEWNSHGHCLNTLPPSSPLPMFNRLSLKLVTNDELCQITRPPPNPKPNKPNNEGAMQLSCQAKDLFAFVVST